MALLGGNSTHSVSRDFPWERLQDLSSVGLSLAVSDIYEDVDFNAPAEGGA